MLVRPPSESLSESPNTTHSSSRKKVAIGIVGIAAVVAIAAWWHHSADTSGVGQALTDLQCDYTISDSAAALSVAPCLAAADVSSLGVTLLPRAASYVIETANPVCRFKIGDRDVTVYERSDYRNGSGDGSAFCQHIAATNFGNTLEWVH
jgi:hypothetical protein